MTHVDGAILRSGHDWITKRYNCITGTDVASILGVGYDSPKIVLRTKISMSDSKRNANPYTVKLMSLGQLFESEALETFKQQHFGDVPETGFVPGMITHHTLPWITGTPDYIITRPDRTEVTEIKVRCYPDMESAMPFMTADDVPDKFFLQVQTYLEITRSELGYLFSWSAKNGYSTYEIRRDKKLWDKFILPRISDFYKVLCKLRSYPIDRALDIASTYRLERGFKAMVKARINESRKTNLTKASL